MSAQAESLSAGAVDCLRADALSRRFGNAVALDGVSLSVADGEVVAVTGPSGAGKSTLGRIVSGIERADAGSLALAGRNALLMPPQARRVAHMFESFALYPTLSVVANVTSPLNAPAHRSRIDRTERVRRVDEVLELTGIAHLRDRLPAQLSGGQKQRVALCRALVQDPSIFVLDEPIGHLDAKLRHQLRGEIRRRQRRLRPGTLWLTPDGLEALAVADRVAVLVGGKLQQFDSPAALFARPANVRVARLIGDPALNVVQARLDGAELVVEDQSPVSVSATFLGMHGGHHPGGRFQLGLRPGSLVPLPESHPLPAPSTDALAGVVYATEPLGSHTIVSVSIGAARVRARVVGTASFRPSQPVRLAFDAAGTLAFDAETGSLLNRPQRGSP